MNFPSIVYFPSNRLVAVVGIDNFHRASGLASLIGKQYNSTGFNGGLVETITLAACVLFRFVFLGLERRNKRRSAAATEKLRHWSSKKTNREQSVARLLPSFAGEIRARPCNRLRENNNGRAREKYLRQLLIRQRRERFRTYRSAEVLGCLSRNISPWRFPFQMTFIHRYSSAPSGTFKQTLKTRIVRIFHRLLLLNSCLLLNSS